MKRKLDHLTPEDRQKIAKLLAQGIQCCFIAARFGIHVTRVRSIAKELRAQ